MPRGAAATARAPSASATPEPVRDQLARRLQAFRAIGPGGESRRHRIARLVLTAALERLDLDAVDRLHERSEREIREGRRWLSYFDMADHLVRLAGVATKLDLDRRPPTRILDLGCGGGLFGFLCGLLGHEAVGIELPAAERPLNHALCRLLGVPQVEARLAPLRPLPALPGRFGLVTALSPQFHRVDRHRFWSVEEWAWFLGHLARDVTGGEGAFYLKINREKRIKGGVYRHDDFFDFARARGASVEERSGIVRFERLGEAAQS
jgi:SAM-dependent methyltransferase